MSTATIENTFKVNSKIKEVLNNKTTRIMVVEDDPSILELVSFALKKKGYSVITCDNALTALEELKKDRVDIIISDLMMPKMDGIEFCSIVKKHYKNIYFIIITAKNKTEDKVYGLNLGADEYISKPFDFMELLARVKAAERIINTQKQLIYLNEELEKLAETDELTRLKNRRYFNTQAFRELERAKRYGHTVATLLIDLDYFKKINDTYGHNIGDEALKAVTRIIKKSTRESDIVCRYSGDEFIVFLPETNPKNAFKVAEKIRKNIESFEFKAGVNKIPLSVSIGIAIRTPKMNSSLKQMLEQADNALYNSKDKGRNKTVISKWFRINDLR